MSVSPLQLRERIPPVHPENLPTDAAPHDDRRDAQRIRQPFPADISIVNPANGQIGATFKVTVEDLSTTGLRIAHSGRLKVGAKYILEIPRPNQPPIASAFNVVRCDEQEGGGAFAIQLQPAEVLSLTNRAVILAQVPPPEKASNSLIIFVVVSLIAAGAATAYFLFVH